MSVTVGDLAGGAGFFVEDDGPGVPEDAGEQVFDVGYSTTTEGTGFGLSIVDEIAEAHGWTVRSSTATAAGRGSRSPAWKGREDRGSIDLGVRRLKRRGATGVEGA